MKTQRNRFITALLSIILILAISGCGGSRDPELTGKWVATGIEISQWDKGDIPSGMERTLELYEDGTGRSIRGEKIIKIYWSSKMQGLTIDDGKGDKETMQYSLNNGKLTLIQFNNQKFIYEKHEL